MQPMEPTANPPRPPDIRPTPNGAPPEDSPGEAASQTLYPLGGIETSQTAPPVPAETYSSWDGPGTSYALPRHAAAHVPAPVNQAVAQADQPQHDSSSLLHQLDSLSVLESPLCEAEPKTTSDRSLIGGIIVGALLAALAIALWKPWESDSPPDTQADHGTEARVTPEQQQPSADSQTQLLPMTEHMTQEPMDDEPLVIPPSEPVPEELPADTVATPEPAQTTLPAANSQEPAPPTTPTAQPQEPAPPATSAAQPQEPSAPEAPPHRLAPKPAAPAQPIPAAPVAREAGERPVPLQATTVRAKHPQSPRNAATPAATGTLTVAVQPWGEVWINGKKRGISPPLLNLQLPPGSYTVELRNAELPSYSQPVQISAGQSVTLRHRFQ